MKKIVLGFLSLFAAILLISNALAITASIGNSRMVLRPNVGETIEKYILVKNVNNVSVKIEIYASGDLEKYVTIKDNNFTLDPGTDKQAHFTIKAVKAGTTETKINVKFTPIDGKSGVGLSSTVTVIAGGNDTQSGSTDDNTGASNNQGTNENAITTPGNNQGTNQNAVTTNNGNKKPNYVLIGLSITGGVLLIFVILLVVASVKMKKNKDTTKKETKSKKSVRGDA